MNKIIQGRCRGASVNSNAVNVYRLDLEIPEDTYNDYLERNFLVKENLHGFPVKDEDGFNPHHLILILCHASCRLHQSRGLENR